MLESRMQELLDSLMTPRGKGATKPAIEEAETQLGVELPNHFKDFLSEFGWGSAGSFEFFGLGDDVPEYLNLLQMTLDERGLCRPNMPHHLIPLLNDGYGNHYCLDTRRIMGDDCPVVFWNHELDEDQVPEVVADSYEQWLLDILREVQDQ